MSAGLEIRVAHAQGTFRLEADVTAPAGVTAIFGRSGSGKTTLVNAVGGLVRPRFARIVVGGETLVDTERRIWLPAHRRRIGYVFQEGRLFPHLTVRQNLLYGRFFAPSAPDGEAAPSLNSVTDLLGIGALLGRRPGGLSGGEKQRVAIGRALLSRPRALLMDEPLASLDEARKQEILPYIERLRDEANMPILYVSHAVPEVARLADTVVVLEDGKVTASGPVREVFARPDLSATWLGRESGAVVEARVADHDPDTALTRLDTAAGTLLVPLLDRAPGSRIRVQIHAAEVILATTRPIGISALNVLSGTIAEIVASPDRATALVSVACGEVRILARLTHHSAGMLGLVPGMPVYALIKSVSFDEGRTAASGLITPGSDRSAAP